LKTRDGSTYLFDGPQVYYKVSLTAKQTYKVSLTADAARGLRAYLFSNTCIPTQIEKDCQSGGVSGTVSGVAASGSTVPGRHRDPAHFTA
jgi:hypothetical protein